MKALAPCLAFLILSGCAAPQDPSPSGSAAVTQKTPEALALTLADLPPGYMGNGGPAANGEWEFSNRNQIIQGSVLVFNTTDEAASYFANRSAEVKAKYSTSAGDSGDESLYWEPLGTPQAPKMLVRKANVVWEIKSIAESGLHNPSIQAVARILVRKV